MESIRFLHMVRYGGINMFISLCKKIKQQLKAKKAWRQVLAYGILAFLIMQC